MILYTSERYQQMVDECRQIVQDFYQWCSSNNRNTTLMTWSPIWRIVVFLKSVLTNSSQTSVMHWMFIHQKGISETTIMSLANTPSRITMYYSPIAYTMITRRV